MTPVILCNHLGRLQRFLQGTSGPLRYICLVESRESRLIREYLSQYPGAEELPKAKLFRERSEGFRRKYIEFMGRLNGANHSRHWWTMTFTTKNPQTTTLCRNTADFLLIVDLLKNDSRRLLVVTDSPNLVAQTKSLGRKQGIRVTNLVKAAKPWRRLLKSRSPAGAIRAFLRTLLLWLLSRRYKPSLSMDGPYLVIATLLHPRSFGPSNGYRDAYFGAVVEHISVSGPKALILGMLVERPFQQLKKLRHVEFSVPIVPLEACLSLGNVMSCMLQALWASFRPLHIRGELSIDGVDISTLVRGAVEEGRHSGDMYLNLRVFYCAAWLARRVRIGRCLYPFENRPWEKMLLLGISEASTDTELVGYQHASLTMAHTNFMLAPNEADITPLPERILTTGEVVTGWLQRTCGIPPQIFETACALRLSQSDGAKVGRCEPGASRVLVALATSLDEYVDMMSFLEKAFTGVDGFQVRIRPHPEFPLESALAISPLAGPVFYTESTGPLAGDLQWADVVLYASSTVAIEGISLGIPAIHLDLGDFLSRDPMSGWDKFKWTAKEPGELIGLIRSIGELPGHEYKKRQQKGSEYVAAYLTPVTTSGLSSFWMA